MDNCESGWCRPARKMREKAMCFLRLGRPRTMHSPDGKSYFIGGALRST